MQDRIAELKMVWKNTYYRGLVVYVSVLVTLIFGFQMYRYFISAPSDHITCPRAVSALTLIPVVGVLLDDG